MAGGTPIVYTENWILSLYMNITILTFEGRETVSKYRRRWEGMSEWDLMPNKCMLNVSIYDVNVGNSSKTERYMTFMSDMNELVSICQRWRFKDG